MGKNDASPTPHICARCGQTVEWKQPGRAPRLCERCKAGKPHASTASVGIFAGMTLAEISVLASQHHMSYGKYRALAETQGRLDVQT